MKLKHFKIGLMVCFLFGINACHDELDIVDPNRLSNESFYENADQAVAAVDAIYNALIIDGMYQRMTPVYNDGRSDELSCRSPWVFLTGLSNFTVPGTDAALEIFWAGHYIMVSRANQALENIPNIEMDEGLRNRLLGQAYFLRALAYFNLTNVHENVPLILETPKGGDSYYPSNEGVTRDMVYSQVKSDLETAIGLLPLNYNSVEGPDQGQFGRATQGAAQSLLGKVFLFEGNYSEAGRYFEAVSTLMSTPWATTTSICSLRTLVWKTAIPAKSSGRTSPRAPLLSSTGAVILT